MPRTIDLQLLGVAMVAGALVAWAVTRRAGARIGASPVLVALGLAWVADRRVVHALPREVADGYGPWMVVGVTTLAVAVGWGAARLPTTSTRRVPPVLPLALASLAGVWVGVPETSAAILAAGVLLGLGAVAAARHLTVTRAGAATMAVVPLGAAWIGAAGERQALVGGVLCSATFGLLAVGSRVPGVTSSTLVQATVLHLAAALVSARHLAVNRKPGGADLVIVLVLALSLAAVAVLRRGQGRPTA